MSCRLSWWLNWIQVPHLRQALNILDAVVYVGAARSDEQELAQPENENVNDELLQLESSELIDIIRRLQVELTRKNTILNFFSTISHDIAKQRDALTTLLHFIDNITATKSSLEELEVKSTACTARPDKIDGDWLREINSNTQLQAWWISDKPRKLKKVCHLEARSSQDDTRDQSYQQTQSSSEGRNQHNSTRPSSARALPQRNQLDHSNEITPSHAAVYSNSVPDRNRRTNTDYSRPRNRPSQQYQNSTRYSKDSRERQQRLQGHYPSQR